MPTLRILEQPPASQWRSRTVSHCKLDAGAVEQGESLILDGARVYTIDDAELERVKNSYPVIWKNPDAAPKLCFVGCPHLSLEQLKDWTIKIENELRVNNREKVKIPTSSLLPPVF